jgi:hypothetical protein
MWKQTAGAVDYANNDQLPIVMQMHKDPEGTTGGEKNPWLTIRMKASVNNASGVPVWTTSMEKNVLYPCMAANSTPNPNPSGARIVTRGSWTDFVIRARYHPWDGYGYVWVRDNNSAGQWVLLSSRTGGIGYATDLKQPYIKFGSYLSLWDSVAYPTRESVNSDNVPVRRWVGRYDSVRTYFGNDGSIAHVEPR